MTMTRHVYSAHIDVASLKWWNTLEPATQSMIQETIYEAAKFQRRENRAQNAARLKLLEEKGMTIDDAPDIDAFRHKVANLQNDEIYSDPKVKDLLQRMLAATR
jgi:TRAP-type C4-dicarboxylate transport system substrate-binding protein